MKLYIYTMYDKVAVQCGTIGLARNDEAALRDFYKGMEGQKNEDYTLLGLGEFNDETGEITNYSPYDVEQELTVNMEITDDGI